MVNAVVRGPKALQSVDRTDVKRRNICKQIIVMLGGLLVLAGVWRLVFQSASAPHSAVHVPPVPTPVECPGLGHGSSRCKACRREEGILPIDCTACCSRSNWCGCAVDCAACPPISEAKPSSNTTHAAHNCLTYRTTVRYEGGVQEKYNETTDEMTPCASCTRTGDPVVDVFSDASSVTSTVFTVRKHHCVCHVGWCGEDCALRCAAAADPSVPTATDGQAWKTWKEWKAWKAWKAWKG